LTPPRSSSRSNDLQSAFALENSKRLPGGLATTRQQSRPVGLQGLSPQPPQDRRNSAGSLQDSVGSVGRESIGDFANRTPHSTCRDHLVQSSQPQIPSSLAAHAKGFKGPIGASSVPKPAPSAATVDTRVPSVGTAPSGGLSALGSRSLVGPASKGAPLSPPPPAPRRQLPPALRVGRPLITGNRITSPPPPVPKR
jgi:hypothetical protein